MNQVELVYEEGTPFDGKMTPSGGYEHSPDTFHLRFDPESEPPAHAVVKAASFVHNADQSDLSPLAHAIDPEALERLLTGPTGSESDCVEVTFAYASLEVTVASDGNLWLQWR